MCRVSDSLKIQEKVSQSVEFSLNKLNLLCFVVLSHLRHHKGSACFCSPSKNRTKASVSAESQNLCVWVCVGWGGGSAIEALIKDNSWGLTSIWQTTRHSVISSYCNSSSGSETPSTVLHRYCRGFGPVEVRETHFLHSLVFDEFHSCLLEGLDALAKLLPPTFPVQLIRWAFSLSLKWRRPRLPGLDVPPSADCRAASLVCGYQAYGQHVLFTRAGPWWSGSTLGCPHLFCHVIFPYLAQTPLVKLFQLLDVTTVGCPGFATVEERT